MRHRAEERDEQADLRPAVEPGVAREGPRDRPEVQRAQELVSVRVRADQDGHVVVLPRPFGDALADHARDRVRLLRRGLEVEVGGHAARRLLHRREVLGDPVLHLEPIGIVVLDESVGAVEDRLMRAVILGEHHLSRLRVTLEEAEDVGDRRTAPLIDRLVVVRDARDVPVARAEQLHDLELSPVRILELVDEDVLEPSLEPGEHVRSHAQEPEGVDDLVAEVDRTARRHQLLVLRVRPGQLQLLRRALGELSVLGRGVRARRQAFRVRRILLGRNVLVLAAADQRDQRLDVSGRIAEGPVALERELKEPVAEENDLLGTVQDAEVGLQPQLERVLTQQPVAERVKRGDLDVCVAIGHQSVDALLHLRRRLVREREREDLLGARLFLGDEPGDPMGDDGGLARTCAGDDEEGPGVVGDGRALRVVQAVEDAIHRHASLTILRCPDDEP